jgi:hypothetical protein
MSADSPPALTAGDIVWSGEPSPQLETLDLRQLSVSELIDYLYEVRQDAALLRELLHEALTQVQATTARLEAALRALRALRASRARHHRS